MFSSTRDRQVFLASLLFVLSGVAALIYQVAWQRILALHSGVGLYSVTMIVAAFLAGLGLGSHAGGVISARVTAAAALRWFVWLEVAIGLLGAVSPLVYVDWLYPVASPLPSPSWRGGLLHAAALVPPTCLMGMSLPFLVRATVADVAGAGRTVGLLYAFNLLGAALGAGGGAWVLIPEIGIRGTVAVAALCNLAVGAGAWLLLRVPDTTPAGETRTAAETASAAAPAAGRPPVLWILLYGLSGFTALSLEILWFRIVDVAVKSTAFTFGTVLGIYLLGNAAGCLVAAPRVARIRRPLHVFLWLQCALLIYSAAVVAAVGHVAPASLGLDWFVDYWNRYGFFALGHQQDAGAMLRLYVLLPLVLFGVPTFLMGVSFPVLQRAVHDDPRTSGYKVGFLQAANIAGCVAGSLLVGLVGLGTVGTTGSFRALLVLGLVFAVIGVRRCGRAFLAPGVALLVLAAAFPGQDPLWRHLHGVREGVMAFFQEDATSVVAVTPDQGAGRRWRLSINGKGNSWFPYGGVHTLLGAIPAALHPAPARVALIGLGSGDTAWAAAWRADTSSLTVFELSSPQLTLLRRLSAAASLPDLQALLDDRRVSIVVADGRKALVADPARYDIIEADAQYPSAAYSGNLYSVEFFRIGASRLAPGGLMCTWAPTPRIKASFRAVFPHVIAVGDGDILVGSLDPIAWDPATWLDRLARGTDYLGETRYEAVARAIGQAQRLGREAAPETGLNRDLFPRDEFAVR